MRDVIDLIQTLFESMEPDPDGFHAAAEQLLLKHPAIALQMEDTEGDGYVYISSISVKDGNKKNAGLGTAFMTDLCALASEYMITLELEPAEGKKQRKNICRKSLAPCLLISLALKE